MKQPKASIVSQLFDVLFQIVGECVLLMIFIGYFVVCLWAFDHLQINDSLEQLALVVAPFVLVGFWLWRKGIVR